MVHYHRSKPRAQQLAALYGFKRQALIPSIKIQTLKLISACWSLTRPRSMKDILALMLDRKMQHRSCYVKAIPTPMGTLAFDFCIKMAVAMINRHWAR